MKYTLNTLLMSLCLQACYLSHGIEPIVEPGDPDAGPGEVCPSEAFDPFLEIHAFPQPEPYRLEAGTRTARIHGFEVVNLSDQDIMLAEWPQRFVSVMASLMTEDGSPVFTNVRLIEARRPTLLGPEDARPDHGSVDDTVEIMLWDALLLRAGHAFTFTLVADIAPGAEGIYDVTSGDNCHLTPRIWLVHADGPETPISIERVRNNFPITRRVTIVSAD